MSPLRLTATAEDREISPVVLAPPRPGVCELVHIGEKILAPRGARAAVQWNRQTFGRSNCLRVRKRRSTMRASRIAAKRK
jgi:hypothetical protein